MEQPSTAPVLLLGFNRPHLMRERIDELRTIAPSRVYIAIDGPRASVPSDIASTSAVRDCIELVDWPCEVHALVRDENLGCGRAVSEAITWFFGHEDCGIILEDDVSVSPDFHAMATELLGRYTHDHRVRSINGLSPDSAEVRSRYPFSYRFSSVPLLWGWASWRRAWNDFSLDMDGWESWLDLDAVARDRRWPRLLTEVLRRRANDCANGAVDTWDTQFTLRSLASNGVHVVPMRALATNVGVLDSPTHSGYEPASLRGLEALDWPLRHPEEVRVLPTLDRPALVGQFEATLPGMARKAARRLRTSRA